MEWDFNIVNWANVEVNSSRQQRPLRRCKCIWFSSPTVGKEQLGQSPSGSPPAVSSHMRLTLCIIAKIPSVQIAVRWGRDIEQAWRQERNTRTCRGGDRAAVSCSGAGFWPVAGGSSGSRDRGSRTAKGRAPSICRQNPGQALNHPSLGFARAERSGAQDTVVHEPYHAQPAPPAHSDQNTRQGTGPNATLAHISKKTNQPTFDSKKLPAMANVSTHHTSHMATLSNRSAKDIRYQS